MIIQPKRVVVSEKNKTIATIEMYTNHTFPTIAPKDKNSSVAWWKIAENFAKAINGENWKTFSREEQKNEIVHAHRKMFPDWSNDLTRKKIILPNQTLLIQELKNILRTCYKHVYIKKPMPVRIFPRRSNYYQACNGHTNVGGKATNGVNIFIDGSKGWKGSLRETLSHEYVHLAYDRITKSKETLTALLIEEGMAMHFSNDLYKRRPRFKRISYAELAQFIKKHRYLLNRKLPKKTLQSIYYDDYIVYIVGYQMFGLFLKTLPGLYWDAIVRNYPKEIMQVAEWALNEKLRRLTLRKP